MTKGAFGVMMIVMMNVARLSGAQYSVELEPDTAKRQVIAIGYGARTAELSLHPEVPWRIGSSRIDAQDDVLWSGPYGSYGTSDPTPCLHRYLMLNAHSSREYVKITGVLTQDGAVRGIHLARAGEGRTAPKRETRHGISERSVILRQPAEHRRGGHAGLSAQEIRPFGRLKRIGAAPECLFRAGQEHRETRVLQVIAPRLDGIPVITGSLHGSLPTGRCGQRASAFGDGLVIREKHPGFIRTGHHGEAVLKIEDAPVAAGIAQGAGQQAYHARFAWEEPCVPAAPAGVRTPGLQDALQAKN